jgi:hypothetical protein
VAEVFGDDPRGVFMATKGRAMRTLGSSDEEIAAACERFLHPHGPGSGYLRDRHG